MYVKIDKTQSTPMGFGGGGGCTPGFITKIPFLEKVVSRSIVVTVL
jgi:hypothetical protein